MAVGLVAINQASINLQIDFVPMPGRAWLGSASAQVCRDHWPEMVYPAPNGLVIPRLDDHDRFAHWRVPMDMISHGWSTSLFQA
jgi:hypothetical protein